MNLYQYQYSALYSNQQLSCPNNIEYYVQINGRITSSKLYSSFVSILLSCIFII